MYWEHFISLNVAACPWIQDGRGRRATVANYRPGMKTNIYEVGKWPFFYSFLPFILVTITIPTI
jgi:hypothetical protein